MAHSKDHGQGGLVLTFTLGDYVMVGDIKITLAKVQGKQVKLRLNAPKDVKITHSNHIDRVDKNDTGENNGT